MTERLQARIFTINSFRALGETEDKRVVLFSMKPRQMRGIKRGDVLSFEPRPITNPDKTTGQGARADMFGWAARIERRAPEELMKTPRSETEAYAGWANQ